MTLRICSSDSTTPGLGNDGFNFLNQRSEIG
jgi:hypothetical protein